MSLERAALNKTFKAIPMMDLNLVDYICEYIYATQREYYPSGQLKRTFTLKFGKYHDTFIEYYDCNPREQPRIKRFCKYDNGVLHGVFKEFHPNGKAKTLSKYNKGKISGPVGVFYPNGKIDQDNSMIHLSCVIS